jgi:hypothetical protein
MLSLEAQNNSKVNEHFIGLHGGYGFSAIYNETNSEVYFYYDDFNKKAIETRSYIPGYSFGISYKPFLERLAGLNIELNYVKKGGYNNFYYDIFSDPGDSIYVLFEQRFDYIELPILTNIRIGKKNSRINFYGGPHIAYLLNQNIRFLESTYGRTYQIKTGNKFDFGLNAGMGYGYCFGKSTVEFVVKYSHSLSNIYEQQTINKSFLSQNQVISGSLYYFFKL